MKICKVCGQEKPLSEYHFTTRDGYGPRCKPCQRERDAEYRAANKDRIAAATARYVENNREKIRERGREWARNHPEQARNWRAANIEKARANARKYMAANPHVKAAWREKHADLIKAVKKGWKQRNPHKVNRDAMERHAKKLRATPPWADDKAIEQYYLIARFLTEETGIDWHVDHVVPLRSKLVCGLHAETNLSIALGWWNIQKNNRMWPDMPDAAEGAEYLTYKRKKAA